MLVEIQSKYSVVIIMWSSLMIFARPANLKKCTFYF